ncbi:MAG: fumarylacetoacetate hydrolase family protein [Bacteroidota bacterium]
MKLIRFGKKGKERPGVEIDNIRYDCSAYFEDWNRVFFQNGGLKKLKQVVKKESANLPIISKKKRLGSPIARPNMIMCVGLNYSDHAAESGMEIPEEPVLFMKATNTIAGPNDRVILPKGSKKVDWEIELGIVMKKDASYLKDVKSAEQYIAGYTIVHDVSERYFQLERSGQWVKGKSCPGFTPTGPYLVQRKDVENVLQLKMHLSVNGITRQKGSTKYMIFKPNYIVWYLSQFMQLEAGDLISTGTPPGVGLGMKPPLYLKDKDIVELSIEGLGTQKHRFVSPK